MRKAVYAGSFDPITNGHLWMIRQAAGIFDHLIAAIGVNPDKRCTFALEQRRAFVEGAVAGIANCSVASFENRFVVDFARSMGAAYIVRGIRNEHDYTYERGMRHVNEDMAPDITTVFLMPPRPMAEISSSMVKGLVGPAGWQPLVQQLVPPAVFQALLERHG